MLPHHHKWRWHARRAAVLPARPLQRRPSYVSLGCTSIHGMIHSIQRISQTGMSHRNKVIEKHVELCQAIEQVREFRAWGATGKLLRPQTTSLPGRHENGVDFVEHRLHPCRQYSMVWMSPARPVVAGWIVKSATAAPRWVKSCSGTDR
jgi:hypothetical protein